MDQTINMAALGRPFSMGMLYDCRSDNLVPGVTLWDSDAFEKHIRHQPTPRTETHVVTSDTIHDKADALGVSAELKLSVLGGLVTVKGAGEYLQDTKKSSEVVRVTLKYESNCHFDQLSMEHLGNYKYPEVFDNGNATHVVTGIEFGADAFFVFEKSTHTNKGSTVLQGQLEAMVKTINVQIEGACDIDLKSDENDETENTTCIFHGDFQLDAIPTTYKEALRVIQRLPQLLKDNPPVPKRVHLYPLCILDTRAAGLVRWISESLIDRVESILQQAINCRAQAASLNKSSTVVSAVPFLQQQLDDYQRILNLATSSFKKELLPLLPAIRGKGEDEEKLATLLCQLEASVAAPGNFRSVLNGIQRTVTNIGNQLAATKKQGIQEAFGPNLDQITTDMSKEFVVCITLNSNVLSSKGLKAISTYLYDKKHLSSSVPLPKEWDNHDKLKTTMKETFRLFVEYAKLNKGGEKEIEYVVTDGEGFDSEEPVTVQVFDEAGGETISLANAPGKPCVRGDTTTSEASIEWQRPTKGEQTVKNYVVWYCRKEDESDGWKCVDAVGIPKCRLTNLKPGMDYLVKVQAITKAGISPTSPVSEPVLMQAEERLALRVLVNCDRCDDTNNDINIFTPKQRFDRSHGKRVKKYEIGEKRLDMMREKTILVVGATGTGKTTLLNSMINYLTGVRLDDDFRFKLITQADEGQESATSVTKNVTAYVLNNTILPYALTVVDTPGYGDTEGLKADKETTNLIKQLFETKRDMGGIDQLDAVCLVVKSTDSRLTSQQLYNFNSVLALFSSDMADNVIIIVTFCDASTPPVILALEEGNVPYKTMYKFNNSAFFEPKKKDKLGSAAHEFYWEVGQASFDGFFKGLETMHPKSLTLSVEVLTKREQLENLVIHLHQQVNSGINDLETMRQEGMVMEEYAAKIKANENFKYKVTEEQVKQVGITDPGTHTTTCVHCNHTCHLQCGIRDDGDKDHCIAMNNKGYCEVCPGKCKWDIHRNLPYICKIVKVEVEKTDEDLRKKYAQSKDDFYEKDKMMANLGSLFGETEMDILGTIKLIKDSLAKLKKIALRPDHLTDVEYIECLIESEKLQNRPGWQQRVHYLHDQKDLAQKLQQAKDPNYDPFREYRQDEGGSGWLTYARKKIKSWFTPSASVKTQLLPVTYY